MNSFGFAAWQKAGALLLARARRRPVTAAANAPECCRSVAHDRSSQMAGLAMFAEGVVEHSILQESFPESSCA